MSSKHKTPDLKAWLRDAADVIEGHPLPGESRGSFERFVLDHGGPLASRKLTVAERAIVERAVEQYRLAFRRFRQRECFGNSQNLLFFDLHEHLVYVEGFAWTHTLFPVLHGWLVLNDKVIDVTLPATTRREAARKEPLKVHGEFAARSYLGVRFERSYVEKRRSVTGEVGSLLDDEQHGYPLLRGTAALTRAVAKR